MNPVVEGPRPLPIRVWMKSRSEVATERMRTVASAWVMAKDGPKNTAAMNINPTNDGSVVDSDGDR